MRKKKRGFGFFDDIFESFFEEFEDFFSEDSLGLSGGYSISVYQTPEGTIVEAQLSDDMDAEEFRKILEEKYPGAKIIIKGGKKSKLIERVREEEKKVTIKLMDEGEKEEKRELSERDELSRLLGGGKRGVFIRRDE